jgi:hypothetical protein
MISALLLLSILWQLRRIDRRIAAEQGGRVSRGEIWLNMALLLISAGFLAVTVGYGVMQDYYLYRGMWGVVREGHDPWWIILGTFGEYPVNAYGPLFNLLAIPDRVNPLLPKLLFAWAYLLFAVSTIKSARGDGSRSRWAAIAGIAWFWNPYAWVELARFGHFDVLVGLCCVAAVEARVLRRDDRAGIFLSLGVLLKYMPVILLPFLILDRGRYRWRLLGVAAAAIALGFAASVAFWGTATFRPIRFAVGRGTEYLSIYRYLEGTYSPLRGLPLPIRVHDLAAPMLLITLLRAWNWSRFRHTEPASAAVLAILTTLLFYQVGFPQYQMVLFVLASYWIVRKWGTLARRGALLVALICYFGWIATFDVIAATRGVEYHQISEWAGLPTVILGGFLIICIVRSSPVEAPQNSVVPSTT